MSALPPFANRAALRRARPASPSADPPAFGFPGPRSRASAARLWVSSSTGRPGLSRWCRAAPLTAKLSSIAFCDSCDYHEQAKATGAIPPASAPSEGASGLVVSYTLTAEDVVEFKYFVSRRRFLRRHMRAIGFTGAMTFFAAFSIVIDRNTLTWPDGEDWAVILTVLTFISALGAGLWYGEPWFDRRLFRKMVGAAAPSPSRAEIAPEGLRVTEGDVRSEVAWRTLVAVEAGPGAIYLFITPNQAYIIPRRAFADAGALDDFVAAIEERRRHG
jgi:hypothetical protein